MKTLIESPININVLDNGYTVSWTARNVPGHNVPIRTDHLEVFVDVKNLLDRLETILVITER